MSFFGSIFSLIAHFGFEFDVGKSVYVQKMNNFGRPAPKSASLGGMVFKRPMGRANVMATMWNKLMAGMEQHRKAESSCSGTL